MPNVLETVRTRLAGFGDLGRRRIPLLQRVPPMQTLLEWAARFGYGARGFVYLSVGVLTLLAAADLIGDAVGTKGAVVWLAEQPLGRVWLMLVAVGLLAFVMWRALQAVFDADHEGRSWRAIGTRMSQAFSGMSYAALAVSALALMLDKPSDPAIEGVVRSQEQAAAVLALPFGNLLLIAGGLAIFGIGAANIVKAWREDFSEYLACSAETRRRVSPLARAGHVARGLAYLPLAVLVMAAGLTSQASDVTTPGAALEVIERQPAGPWIVALCALGFIAFGAFSFIEARFRRIRPPRDLAPF